MAYIRRASPDVIILAWPCSVWSSLQNINMARSERARRQIMEERDERMALLNFVARVVQYQMRHKRHVLLENLRTSEAWKQLPIQSATFHTHTVLCDMCAFGLKHTSENRYFKKPTRLEVSSKRVQAVLQQKCPWDHEHQWVQGHLSKKTMARWPSRSSRAATAKVSRWLTSLHSRRCWRARRSGTTNAWLARRRDGRRLEMMPRRPTETSGGTLHKRMSSRQKDVRER